jgi:hypothetical protein
MGVTGLVRLSAELAPGVLALVVGQLAEDPDDLVVVGDDFRVNLRRFSPDGLPQGYTFLGGQAEFVKRLRELPGKLAERHLLGAAVAGLRLTRQHDIEARASFFSSNLDSQGFAEDLVQVRVVDQANPVREHLREQNRSLVVGVKRPAEDDPLAELRLPATLESPTPFA